MTQESLFSDIEPKTEYDQKHRDAQLVFEALLGDEPYGDRYAALVGEGWEWRKAALIAWESLPSEQRDPKTKGELAKMMGVSRGMFASWKSKYPAIAARIATFSASYLVGHVADVDQALLESAKNPSYKHKPDRDLLYQRIGLITQRSKVDLLVGESQGKALQDMDSEELLAELAREEAAALAAQALEEGGADDC